MRLSRRTTNRRRTATVPVALVVEERDRFFAAIATPLVSARFQVVRATTSDMAHAHFDNDSPDLIVANCELPDESGWLMASKWCLGGKAYEVWLYQSSPAAFDDHWQRFTKVEHLFYHEGSAACLTGQIRQHLSAIARHRARCSS